MKHTIDPMVAARLVDAAFFGVVDELLDLLKEGCTLEDLDKALEEAADKMAEYFNENEEMTEADYDTLIRTVNPTTEMEE